MVVYNIPIITIEFLLRSFFLFYKYLLVIRCLHKITCFKNYNGFTFTGLYYLYVQTLWTHFKVIWYVIFKPKRSYPFRDLSVISGSQLTDKAHLNYSLFLIMLTKLCFHFSIFNKYIKQWEVIRWNILKIWKTE